MKTECKKIAIIGAAGQISRMLIERLLEETDLQLTLAWLWKKGIDSPIMGVTKENYLDDFLGAFDVKLTEQDITYLDELYKPHKVVGAL
ncbi:aldo/keto reductase [Streptococcus macacae NCTC 11558]|uniref:Oxidoreductase, aldo/keto reductase domain protein n=1 Tax=Streptococcus macacae NCTC 11558 TaxID=764298 RepID=G5JZ45_9STRE|nr:oxidoreductase, aldo/keto reductase domain protein [Streptococcus macacae NCTC 11558]SUN78298.1 aldo/keto reductase [Streptococcus macacae NCTC 11558]